MNSISYSAKFAKILILWIRNFVLKENSRIYAIRIKNHMLNGLAETQADQYN